MLILILKLILILCLGLIIMLVLGLMRLIHGRPGPLQFCLAQPWPFASAPALPCSAVWQHAGTCWHLGEGGLAVDRFVGCAAPDSPPPAGLGVPDN